MSILNSNIRFVLAVFISFFILIVTFSAKAQESVCAVVKIEILQELTLERQGFEAELKIGNVLDSGTLENISINVWFKDENEKPVLATSNPNDTSAKFFIDVQSMKNIDNVTGSGRIAAGQDAVVKWLIIPAPGASGGRERGTLYFVGADFNYTLDGKAETITVAPDTIYVKPMPLLTLDYFIPRDVYGDDPFTDAIEQPEPFTLGVRVQNNGFGDAKKLKIDSAQPKIVENKQGLLINFELLSSYVGNEAVANSLLLNFGDIKSKQAKVGRWQMQVSLSGRFTEFGATFSHADELGGALTSLLEATKTHFLIRDVLSDLPGRDDIRDFLAEGLSGPRLFESDGATSDVQDLSNSATLVFDKNIGVYARYKLTVPTTAGLLYTKVSDPLKGTKEIAYVTRSDGKNIHKQNAWQSRVQERSTKEWKHFVSLFDSFGTDTYYFYFQDIVIPPRPPVIAFIPQRVIHETANIGFIVEASDPDGNPVSISAASLPAGATVTDNGNGTANFNWTPAKGQAGLYSITYTANDGFQSSSRSATILVNPFDDIDGDGLNDDWELQHFGNLDQDGLGDPDGDGISNASEFENGTNPSIPDGPPTPTIFSPALKGEVETKKVELSVENGTYTGPHKVVYQFEIYSDEAMTTKLGFFNAVAWDADGVSSWEPDLELQDNTHYYWRARTYDGYTYSSWANGQFFANTANDKPTIPQLSFPALGAKLDNSSPKLEVSNSTDVDGDKLYYNFKLFTDSDLNNLAADSGVVQEGANGMTSWRVGVALDNGVTYYWVVMVTDEHNAAVSSDVFNFIWQNANQAPPSPTVISPNDNDEVTSLEPKLSASNVLDPDGDNLEYLYQIDRVNTFDSPVLVQQKQSFVQGNITQEWTVPALNDNSRYYWRVKAVDSNGAESDWTNASFFVNLKNDAPSQPTIKNPGNEAWVNTLTPNLEVNSSPDVDGDKVRYEFELYNDIQMAQLLAQKTSDTPEWLTSNLSDNRKYYWRVRAVDDEGLASEWNGVYSFFVNDNDYDDPPTLSWVSPSSTIKALPNSDVVLEWRDDDPDSSAMINLYYSTYENGTDRVLIASGIQEDNDSTADRYTWNVGELDAGLYYLFAEISDNNTTNLVKGLAQVEVVRKPVIPGNIIVSSEPVLELLEAFENPGSLSFTVKLDKAPESDVSIVLTNPIPSRLNMSISSLVFNSNNWDQAQTVVLTPVNNCRVDKHFSGHIKMGLSVSDDPAFNGLKGKNVAIQVKNDDVNMFEPDGATSNQYLGYCGRKVTFSLGVWGFNFEMYDIYAQNVSQSTIKSVTIKIEPKNSNISSVYSSIKFKNMAPGTYGKGQGFFHILYKSDDGWLNPDWYQLKLKNLKLK